MTQGTVRLSRQIVVIFLKEVLILSFNKRSVDSFEYIVGTFIGIDWFNFTESSVMVDYRHCVVHISVESLFEALHVVVSSAAASLSTLKASPDAFLLRALEKEYKQEAHLLGHLSRPALQVVFVARKSINQEFVVASFLQKLRNKSIFKSRLESNSKPNRVSQQREFNYLFCFYHRVLEETASNLDGDNFAIRNVVLNEGPKLRPFPRSFLPQQIASRQVCEPETFHDFFTLSSFACA